MGMIAVGNGTIRIRQDIYKTKKEAEKEGKKRLKKEQNIPWLGLNKAVLYELVERDRNK